MKENVPQPNRFPFAFRMIRWGFPIIEKLAPALAYQWAFKLFFSPIRFKQPEREFSTIAKAKCFISSVNGKKTMFYHWGDPSNPSIVLVHGWMGRAGQFYKLTDRLLAAEFHVVAFDGPAHGSSEGTMTNLNEFVDAIAVLNDKFGPVKQAVGHSFGGIVVLYAIKLGLPIEDIVLIATPTIGEDIIAHFLSRIKGNVKTGIAFKKVIKRKYGLDFNDLSATSIIQHIRPGSLMIVHDNQDMDVPISHALALVEKYPKAVTEFSSGLGHTRILRDNEIIDKIVSFIEKPAATNLSKVQ